VALRRLVRKDASIIQLLAGDAAIAEMTLTTPHPYPDSAAEEWIEKHEARWTEGTRAVFAVTARPDFNLIGCSGVQLDPARHEGEIGDRTGRPFWGRVYCTAALRLFLRYCFFDLDLERVQARHFIRNPASGRVMEKAGMRREGTVRQHITKSGREEDLVVYSLSRRDFA
jgi:[ribosomal protein S5]-alanine N-acetyltransferase